MSGEETGFEETLAELERQRESVEEEYLSRLATSGERVDEVAGAADRWAEAARSRRERVAGALESIEASLSAIADELDGLGGGRPAWPAEVGFVDRLVMRLLRDYLVVLDRRDDELRRCLERTGDELASLGDRIGALRRQELVGEGEAGPEDRGADIAAGRDALRRVVDALVETTGVLERLRHLVDAKDAEVSERLTSGPMRRADLILEELARQQEALLAELARRVHGEGRGE